MNAGLVGLYALYFIFVGINGNAKPLMTEVEQDAKSFAPWLLSIIVLKSLYSVDALRPAVKPFIGLALLTFVLKNYSTVIGQIDAITGLQLPGATGTPAASSAATSAEVGATSSTLMQGALSLLTTE
jgi:hypothetical protein